MDIAENHRSEVAMQVLDAGALIAGSPTLNNNIFPSMADVLTYLKGLKPKNLIGAEFGSYGWSGEAASQIKNILAEMKVELIGEGINAKYVPDSETLTKCYSLGVQIAEKLKEVVNNG
jgi:flavorubredoxin